MAFARREAQAGANSEGFRTTVFPAANAPIIGSKDSPMFCNKMTTIFIMIKDIGEEIESNYYKFLFFSFLFFFFFFCSKKYNDLLTKGKIPR